MFVFECSNIRIFNYSLDAHITFKDRIVIATEPETSQSDAQWLKDELFLTICDHFYA